MPMAIVVQQYDTLRILIRPSRSNQQTHQVTLFQPGVPVIGGPVRVSALITDADVQQIRRRYEQQVRMFHELAAGGAATASIDVQPLIALGRQIGELLPPLARQSLVMGVQHARQRRQGLRLVFEVTPDARNLLSVPWELMVLPLTRGAQTDDGGESLLLLNADLSMVRQVQGVGGTPPPSTVSPLFVQAFAAEPEHARPVNAAATKAALDRVRSASGFSYAWYDGRATVATICERLRTTDPQVLHLVCHGEPQKASKNSRNDLLLTHPDGFVHRVSAYDLGPALTLAPNLQLVVLYACDSGSDGQALPKSARSGDPQRDEQERYAVESIALALIRQGIPVVVALQGQLAQRVTEQFVQTFYQVLADGGSVEQAVAEGRITIRSADMIVDWSLPVIYHGSGRVEQETWYTRLADWADAGLRDPLVARLFRSTIILWSLLLVVFGLARWIAVPDDMLRDVSGLASGLMIWLVVGVVAPMIIAATQKHASRTLSLTPEVRRSARYGQWMGAYMGYVITGIIGLLVLVSLWLMGMLLLLPTVVQATLLGAVLLLSVAGSYTISRSQWRVALAIALVADNLFSLRTTLLLIGAMLLVVVVPFGVFLFPPLLQAVLLTPAAGALALALMLVVAVMSLTE